MASIATQINIVDRMSSPLHNITSAVEQVISSLQSVDGAINNGFDHGAIDNARRSVDQANVELDEMMQSIRRNTEEQDRFNRTVHQGSSAMDGLGNKVIGMVAAYAGFQGVQKIVALSDSMTQTTARLNLMNDGLQTTEELQDKIFASAQRSRTGFLETADVVAKLGQRAKDAFSSNDETIAFAENLNKMFVIAGASQQEISSASLQLTQALGSGVLRGEELNAVFESAPNVIQAIADYMDVPIGKIRELAQDGQISASIVKNALLSATDEVNAQFESMPMTWGQVWTGIVNELIYASQPLLEFISLLAQNWSILEPIVIGLAAAVGIYTAALLIYNAIQGISAIKASVHAAALMMQQGATFAATAAQYGFNAALLACPITWILLIIIAVIAAIYAIVAAINKVTGSTLSATGIITGAIAAAGAFIWNIIVGVVNAIIGIGVELWNLIATFANFFANVFNDPVGAILNLFSGMFDFILGIVQAAAKLIDTVLGSDLAGAVQGFRNDFAKSVGDIVGDQTVVMEKLNASDYQFKGLDYGQAFDAGYKFGEGIDDKVSGMFGGGLSDTYGGYDPSSIPGNLDDIAGNTGDMKDSVTASEEDLKYLRDIAETEAVNRFTTAEIKIEQTNHNTISSNMDIDGVVNHLTTGVNEAMEKAAEGVHE